MTRRQGFLLLEALPAMAVLFLAIIGTWRLVWTSGEVRGMTTEAALRESVLPIVWHHWENDSGRVALVDLSSAEWTLSILPDATWLPDLGFSSEAQNLLVLKREPVVLSAGRPAWRISRWRPTMSGDGDWNHMTTVFRDSAEEEAERE